MLALAASLAGLACGTTHAYPARPGDYDRVPEAWLPPLRAARLAFDRGDPPAAYGLVAPLALERPRVLCVRVFLQELELALLSGNGHLGNLTAGSPAEARAALEKEYETRAEARPTAEDYVLAARLAEKGEQALELLDEANALDPQCVWVDYARAWWRAQLRRFKEARDAVRAVQKRDPGHLPTLRLHATLMAGAGDAKGAAAALEIWLQRTRDDPCTAAAERADGLLDLAALNVLLGEPKAALALLEELDPRAVRDPVRAEEVRAAALDARGDLTAALEAARRASQLAPEGLLPLVQQALLLERAGDTEGERALWLRLLEVSATRAGTDEASAGAIDFEAALFRLQAHARLEHLAGARP